MFSLDQRQDGFRVQFPKTYLCKPLKEKYTKIIGDKKQFIIDPIDFLNETIKGIDFIGFNQGTIQQQQPFRGMDYYQSNKLQQSNFLNTDSDVSYRNPSNPLSLIDKQFVIKFRHTLGYLNYFMLFENFFYQYMRDFDVNEIEDELHIDLLDIKGSIISRLNLKGVLIDAMDNLHFDYTNPTSTNGDFQVTYKFSNMDYQFIGSIEKD